MLWLKAYLFSGSSCGSTRKLRFTMISWANFKLDRSRAEAMTSSSVIAFGGLAVDARPKQSSNEPVNLSAFLSNILHRTWACEVGVKNPHSLGTRTSEYNNTSILRGGFFIWRNSVLLRHWFLIQHQYKRQVKHIQFNALTQTQTHTHLQEGELCLLESLVKLCREHSKSLADVTLSHLSDSSVSLLWSSLAAVDVEVGRSSFSGIVRYHCRYTQYRDSILCTSSKIPSIYKD